MMHARPVAGDELGDPVRYAVQLHVLMSQAELALWERLAERQRLAVDDVVYTAALAGLKDQLAHDGDEAGTDVAEVCERELQARLGREGVAPDGVSWKSS